MSAYACSIVALKTEEGVPWTPSHVRIGDPVKFRREPNNAGAIAAYHGNEKVGYLAAEKTWIWKVIGACHHEAVVVGAISDEQGGLVALDVEISVRADTNASSGLLSKAIFEASSRFATLSPLVPGVAVLLTTFGLLAAFYDLQLKSGTIIHAAIDMREGHSHSDLSNSPIGDVTNFSHATATSNAIQEVRLVDTEQIRQFPHDGGVPVSPRRRTALDAPALRMSMRRDATLPFAWATASANRAQVTVAPIVQNHPGRFLSTFPARPAVVGTARNTPTRVHTAEIDRLKQTSFAIQSTVVHVSPPIERLHQLSGRLLARLPAVHREYLPPSPQLKPSRPTVKLINPSNVEKRKAERPIESKPMKKKRKKTFSSPSNLPTGNAALNPHWM